MVLTIGQGCFLGILAYRFSCGIGGPQGCEIIIIYNDIVTRIEKGLIRWFGHIERMRDRNASKRYNNCLFIEYAL